MASDLRAQDLGHGILLSGIESQAEALYFQQFFGDNGLAAAISVYQEECCQILLKGVSAETYNWLRSGVAEPYWLPQAYAKVLL